MSLIEIILWSSVPVSAILGSWIMFRVKVGKMENSVYKLEPRMEAMSEDVNDSKVAIAHLQSQSDRLEEDGREFKKVVSSLNKTLGELNTTLGRMDERMKNVEDAVRK